MAGRPLFALLALILLAGGILLEIFIILSGVITTTPMPKIWFLEAGTGGIGGSPTPAAAWTYFSLCTYANGETTDCGKVRPAFPFNPPENFGTTHGLPPSMVGTSHFYYLSRFAWVFYLVALFFAVIALFTGILALCTRIGAYLSGLNAFLAMFFQALTAALMTAWTIQARNAFRAAGTPATLGRYAYGFTWASFVCYFLAMIFFCVGGSAGRKEKKQKNAAGTAGTTGGAGGGLFGRKPSTRSRETGVKDDYS